MKTYRKHNCTAKHRTYKTLAKCMYRRAGIRGEGEFAHIEWCENVTMVLYDTEEKALAALASKKGIPCGHWCRGRHEVVRLEGVGDEPRKPAKYYSSHWNPLRD